MTVQPDALLRQLQWRYAVKKFDSSRKIEPEAWNALEQALILSPSSYGLQPWRFLVITAPEVKDQLPAISWNQTQPKECSHMVVFTAREHLDSNYLDNYIAHTESSRGMPTGALTGFRKMLASSVETMQSHFDWNCRQVYIALGQLMTAAAMLGVDSCPMEGIIAAEYDKLLGLSGSGYRTVVACALGYRDPSDTYATAKKVRFATEIVLQRV
ncbi:MAG: NAD(P)H-dependent oxidoreductase [Pirellulales bacterium]